MTLCCVLVLIECFLAHLRRVQEVTKAQNVKHALRKPPPALRCTTWDFHAMTDVNLAWYILFG